MQQAEIEVASSFDGTTKEVQGTSTSARSRQSFQEKEEFYKEKVMKKRAKFKHRKSNRCTSKQVSSVDPLLAIVALVGSS